MLFFLPAPMRGAIVFSIFFVSTLLWALPIYSMIGVKLLMPTRAMRRKCLRALMWLSEGWSMTNVHAIEWLLQVQWDIRGAQNLDRRGMYVITPNHQSWVDIVVLQRAFGRNLPFFKFFLKQQLRWVPILGPVWWALDYPFMKRHSAAKLRRNPELRKEDMETTRRVCERAGSQPLTLLNFPEGTRFTPAKQQQSGSPYSHLLRPRPGGLALTIDAMGEKLNTLLDVTIVYPDGVHGMWGFLCGRISRIMVDVRRLRVPHDIAGGDYQNDPAFRRRFQHWLSRVWREKDARFTRMLQESGVIGTGHHHHRDIPPV